MKEVICRSINFFFTKIDDFTGYFGGFIPAHLWFLLFLFLISLAAYPCLHYMKKVGAEKENSDMSMLQILPLFLVFWATSILVIGQPIFSQFCYFVAGLVLFSKDVVLQKLQRLRKPLFAAAIVTIAISAISAYCLDWGDRFSIWNLILSAYQDLAAWLMICTCILYHFECAGNITAICSNYDRWICFQYFIG